MFTNKDIRCFVPTCNRPGLLQITLKTLLWQEGGPWDIYILDNSTNEATKQLIENKFPQIHYIDNRADRCSSYPMIPNLLKLRELAQTPYFLTLHDDDLLSPIYLKNALKILNTYQDISGVFAKLKIFSHPYLPKKLDITDLTMKHWLLQNKSDFAMSFWDKPASTWSGSILKSDLYKKVSLEDLYKNFGKIFDLPFLSEMIGDGKICIFNDAYIYYSVHDSSYTQDDTTAISLKQFINWLNYYKRFAGTDPKLQKIYNTYVHIRASVAKINLSKKMQDVCSNMNEFLKSNDLLFKPESLRWKLKTKWYFKQFERLERKFYNYNNYYNKFLRDFPKE